MNSKLRQYIPLLAGTFTIFIVMLLFYLLFHPFTVVGSSMYPSFEDGDILHTNIRFNIQDIHYNDVIIFDEGKENYIKRVVGLPGDKIQIQDGILYVNNEKYKEYAQFDIMENAGIAGNEIILNNNEFFVLGDNRNASNDSRKIGVIKSTKIKAVVINKLFNF